MGLIIIPAWYIMKIVLMSSAENKEKVPTKCEWINPSIGLDKGNINSG